MSQNKNYWTVPNLDDSVWKNQKSRSCLELRRAWDKSSKRGEGNSYSGINCTGRDGIFQADVNWSPAIKHTMSKTTRISLKMGVKELFPQLKCDFPGIHREEKIPGKVKPEQKLLSAIQRIHKPKPWPSRDGFPRQDQGLMHVWDTEQCSSIAKGMKFISFYSLDIFIYLYILVRVLL